MAQRPVFLACDTYPYVREDSVVFEFHPGFSLKQKQKTIESLHHSFLQDHPDARILEVSSKSTEELGTQLSAFVLKSTHDEKSYTVESAFQSSKVFEGGGPYTDLLDAPSREAKRDPRLTESGALVAFQFFDHTFPLTPTTCFYDWLYIQALTEHSELADQTMAYTAFTDIEFNPARSMNCQARSVATYVGLRQAGALEEALKSPRDFIRVVFHEDDRS